jgi:hypothetical protein
MRQSCTDDRLDDLNHRVGELSRRMDDGFNRVGADLRALDTRFDAMHRTMIGMQRTMLQIGAGLGVALIGFLATFVGLVATQT